MDPCNRHSQSRRLGTRRRRSRHTKSNYLNTERKGLSEFGRALRAHSEYFSLWCQLVQVIVPTAENLRP